MKGQTAGNNRCVDWCGVSLSVCSAALSVSNLLLRNGKQEGSREGRRHHSRGQKCRRAEIKDKSASIKRLLDGPMLSGTRPEQRVAGMHPGGLGVFTAEDKTRTRRKGGCSDLGNESTIECSGARIDSKS